MFQRINDKVVELFSICVGSLNIFKGTLANAADFINIIPKFKALVNSLPVDIDDILNSAEIEIKYSGYIERESVIADKIKRLEHIKIKKDINFDRFESLSIEARQKLNKIKPTTIGQASRISGVSPSDINVLLIHFGR